MKDKTAIAGLGIALAVGVAYLLSKGDKAIAGDTKCIGNDLYQYDGEVWVLQEVDSPLCPTNGNGNGNGEPPPPVYIYSCPYCPAEFATRAELDDHIFAEHSNEPDVPPILPGECVVGEPDKCDVYDRYRCIDSRWELLEQHSDYCGYEPPPPSDEKVIPCLYCGYMPIDRDDLMQHMSNNHPDMPYIISVRPQTQEVIAGYAATFFFDVSIPGNSGNRLPFGYYIKAFISGNLPYDSEYGGPRYLMSDSGGWGNRFDMPGIWHAEVKVSTKYQPIHPPPPYSYLSRIAPAGIYEVLSICSKKNGSTTRTWLYAPTGATVITT